MSIAPGTRLGGYEIVTLLGAGGMGEVYRAIDLKLGRTVAIKVLPEALASDPGRVTRFEREARVLASLNHPNIAALFGMDQSDERHFLVMELVDGDTLAVRLRRGALPLEEALAIAIEIADALDTAHEQGIVHRDLKPANVKIAPDGHVKVLDFGLAKVFGPAEAGRPAAAATDSPTLSVLATEAGVILGTAAYMSPEQAKGAFVDRRSDVFSFGVVLYEMLTGRQAFRGETAAEVMASVLIHDADLSAFPATIAPRCLEIIKRCLEKHPKKRWQSMGDLRMELEALANAPPRTTGAIEGTSARPASLWRRAAPIVGAIALSAAAMAVVIERVRPQIPPRVVQFSIPSPNFRTSGPSMALSPNGAQLVYATVLLSQSRLMLRDLGEREARPISGASETLLSTPVFSPDGRSIAYYSFDDSSLKRIPVTGGVADTLCRTASNVFGMSWRSTWLYYAVAEGIFRVSEAGGEPELIVRLAPGQRAHGPQALDEKGSLLFTFAPENVEDWDKAQVVLQSPSGSRQVIVEGGTDARYLPTGHIVYGSAGRILAAPLDVGAGRVLRGPTPVVEGVLRGSFGAASPQYHFAVSEDGSMVYVPGTALGRRRTLGLLDPNGAIHTLGMPPNNYVHPRVSPNGRQVVVGTDDGSEAAIWIGDLAGTASPRRLTLKGRSVAPIWTPDGQSVTFQSDIEGDHGLFVQRADGTAVATRLTKADSGAAHFPDSWTPDGKLLAFRVSANRGSSIWVLSRDGGQAPRPLIQIQDRLVVASEFAPDGRWLAYGSNELNNRTYQVFVQPFPLTGAKYLATTLATSTPVWSRDGKQLFFAVANRVFRVEVQTASGFSVGQPTELSTASSLPSQPFSRNFDVLPDGTSFLVVLPEGAGTASASGQSSSQINVVLNWFEELKQKVPAR